MSKFRVDSPVNTPLDPQAFEKQFIKPNTNNPYPFSGVTDQLEFVAPEKVDEGYGTMGNAGYANQIIAEAKAANQSTLDLVGKGLFNIAKTIGIEVAKVPGYVGGLQMAGYNEMLGTGKDSMSMIVDNAWINAFEGLDQNLKEAVPVYMSKQVQEGNLMDKLGSGAWWAESGADGLGFMLSMFVPGAAAKALGVGARLARIGEAIGNIAPRLGKLATGAGLLAEAGEAGFVATETLARNAGGFASATINTTLEASAEAANTFDNVKKNYLAQGLSEDEAKGKAGEAAAAVFKGNLALLAVSNVLDEMWIWKTIGSSGQKEAAQSMLSKIFKDGVVDMDAVKNISKEFTKAKVLGRTAGNFAKNVVKEGFYEEGSQTTLQQNIEKGKNKNSVLGNLSDIAASYFDDFSNNTELQESIFLGGLLGGGASVISTVQENNALRNSLTGGQGRTKENSIWAKYGILPETKDQKGLVNILQENHIKQFRTYKDFLEDDGQGGKVLNEQKLIDANLEQANNLRTNILYDLAVAQGDKLGTEIYGQDLAANYAQGFLGQEGGKELFEEHVKKQVLPAWQQRYLDTYGTDPTSKQSQEYVNSFIQSGNRIFDAHKTAEETNHPERYFHEKSKEYQDFKQEYFHNKFQTLVNIDSIKTYKQSIMNDMMEAGVSELDLEDINKIQDPVKQVHAKQIKDDLQEAKDLESKLGEQYTKFYTKKGVEEMFNAFKNRTAQFEEIRKQVLEENQKLKEEVDNLPAKNQAEVERLNQVAQEQGGGDVNFKDKDGNAIPLSEVPNQPGDITQRELEFDDVSREDWGSFQISGTVSDQTIKKIVQKIINNTPLSGKEQAVASAYSKQINDLLQEEKQKLGEVIKSQEPQSNTVEDQDANETDAQIDSVYKKKGVNMYPSTSRNLQNEVEEMKPGVFVEKMTTSPSQKLWFETLDKEVKDNPTAYTVQVVRLDKVGEPELLKQLLRDSDPTNSKPGDLYTVLYKDGKPVLKEGNYVFTGLWRPDTLYPTKNGKPFKFVLAEQAVLDNFLIHAMIPGLDITNLSENQKEHLKNYGVIDTSEQSIMTHAFFHGKEEYTKWYQDLQDNPGQLQVAGITKGHTVKMFSDKEKKNPIWGQPLNGIPGLKLVNDKLIGGKFEMSTTGTITVDNELFKIAQGDVVIVDKDNNVHPMRARNLTDKEAQTVLYLLSLRSQPGPTESIKLKAPEPVTFGNTSMKEVPVFFNTSKSKSRANLIESMISFGSKNGGKGEIYFNKASIGEATLLVWTDFEGQTHNIDVNLIKQAVDTNDFSKVQGLLDFLLQKRFNVNEHLLLNNNTFSKPQLVYKRDETGKSVAELEWDQTRGYYDVLLNDVLTTTTQQVEGYPKRAQRNIWFNKQPVSEQVDVNSVENKQEPVLSSLGERLSKIRILLNELFNDSRVDGPRSREITSEIERLTGSKGATLELISRTIELDSKTITETIEANMNISSTNKSSTKEKVMDKIKNRKSLDSFKEDMDKILTTSDLLKAKIQNGEIIQNCK